ncbi:MAG: helix-turn-helix domain-containing protein [Nocardioides sp.]
MDRALTILEALARQGEAGVTDLARDLGVHKSTAFRLVVTLESHGLVEQTEDRGKYRLGVGLLRLAGATTARLDVVQEARPSAASWLPTPVRPSTSRFWPTAPPSTWTRWPGPARCSRTTGSGSTSPCTRRPTARCCSAGWTPIAWPTCWARCRRTPT